MLVMTVRHIGKLPHSKLPQYGQTQWQRMSPEQRLPEDFPGHRWVGPRVMQCCSVQWCLVHLFPPLPTYGADIKNHPERYALTTTTTTLNACMHAN